MQLTQEHEELRRNLSKFIDNEINPHVDEWEDAEIFPAHELFKKMGALGFLGLTKAEEYGGMGLVFLRRCDGGNAGPNSLRRDSHGDRRAHRHGDASVVAVRRRRSETRISCAIDQR